MSRGAAPSAGQPSDAALREIAALPTVRQLGYGRYLAVATILVMLGLIAKAFAEGQIEWSVVGRFLTAPAIIDGFLNTIWMTACAMALAMLFHIVLPQAMRIDASVQGNETLPYFQAMEPNTDVPLGEPLTKEIAGLPVLKSKVQLRDGIKAAMDNLIKNGTCAELLDKYGLSRNGLKEITINAGK